MRLGYETAHVGKWRMGNDGRPRPGYHRWVSYDGHGPIVNPTMNHDGEYRKYQGYITDIMNALALELIEGKRRHPWSLFFAHKAVRTDRHKLIQWVKRGQAKDLDELYDLHAAPYELENLIASPAHAALRRRLERESQAPRRERARALN